MIVHQHLTIPYNYRHFFDRSFVSSDTTEKYAAC